MEYIYMDSGESSGEEYEPPPDIEFSPEHTESEIEEDNPIEEADNDGESENSNSGGPWWTDRVPMQVTEAAENIDITEIYDVSAVARQAHSSTTAPPTTGEPPRPEEAAKNDSPVKSSQRKSNGADASVDDDGQTCTICFEPWTNTSEHRLISLRCGHLFGRSCITRWLKGQNARCPQCNARARKSEIRNIYAKTVKAIDSTERDQALLDLQKESERRRKAEMETAQEKLKYVMKAQECEQLKQQLMDTHQLLQEYRLNKKHETKPVSHKPASSFNFEKCVEMKSGTCRIMDVSDMLNMILVSQQSPSQMFPGFGIRKLSTSDFKPSEFILIHTKVIKDLSFHPRDALVLTASLDRSVKITNVLTNSNVQTYQLDCDAWSCAWDQDNPLYFYAGTKMSNVFLYDIRVTSRHVQELPRFGFHTPVISLQYISQSSNPSLNMSGPLVGKLSDCGFLKKTTDGGVHNSHPFLTVGPLASLSSNKITGHFLISCRPSNNQPRLTHTLCELVTSPHETTVQYNPIQVVSGGRNQIQLTRSKLLNHPSDPSSLLICAGDEDAGGALIWDGSSGQFLECLKSDSCILDFQEIQVNDRSLLMSLTDSSLRLYSWSK